MKIKNLSLILLLTIPFWSCSKDEQPTPDPQPTPINLAKGSGTFNYDYESTSLNKTLGVYYYIPENITPTTPIVFVFHGTQRNAGEYRDAMIAKADEFGFIAIVPEFSTQDFPGGDGYNLGNVFIDGDNPTEDSLNQEEEWAFSIIEPLFDYTKTQVNNTNSTYDVFGHSAGGQFSHRFAMFKPNARFNKMVSSSSGWFTFPDASIRFPYGFDLSPLKSISLSNLFSKQIYVQVGENDDDPNAASLRHNDYADAQGLNRKERAINFFQFSQNLSQENNTSFNWNFEIVTGMDHDYIEAAENAADILFK
ncbi:hypothetical protein C7447_104103 [Tenacibaculum adriaticum]|uniref:Esterase n=1 Tax=Tenacibaculum adriaticum TaxID=413713 RepID=A0A5S5DNC7_9FLAO|nr:hypothetical protein [Tenacibaculum adriaticum]TYP97417.1 hypothetical protein C7447_104103 [Tenacibaculum adriaticum]